MDSLKNGADSSVNERNPVNARTVSPDEKPHSSKRGGLTGKYSRGYFIYLVVFLGLLSAFGPFVTDMYLPAFPLMLEAFHTTEAMVLLGVTTSLLGLAIGQVFFGPLSDKYGRRPMLFLSLLMFLVFTFMIIYSRDIEFFLLCRFFQGLAGAGGIVLSRSVATDAYTGRDLATILAIIGSINGVTPVFAPVIGGLIPGWRNIFWTLFGLGAALLLLTFLFRESLPGERRFKGNILKTFTAYGKLARLPRFVRYVMAFTLMNGALFAYISSSSFVIQSHYGLSPISFSILFGVNAIAIAVGAMSALKSKQLKNGTLLGCSLGLLMSLMQLVNACTFDNFYLYEPLMFIVLIGVGAVFSTATTLAMNEGRHYTGAASAVVGSLGFLFGGIVSSIVGMGNIMVTTSLVMIACTAAGLAFAIAIKRDKDDEWNDVL